MTHEEYMQKAILAAEGAKRSGGVGIGAVLVRDETGEIVAAGGSYVGVTKDPTSHAEVNCIRMASSKLGTDDLYGCTLYCTLEPCHMCLSCAAWARIPHVYFGAYRKDVDPSLFETKDTPGDEQEAAHMNLRENVQMEVHGGILEQDCAALLTAYHDGPRHTK
jgi:tRNA(Arg) A34 adenosine deaminase TadA